ncbi:hypothetical protein OG285_05975 [Streptomyces sp. NBC_01471]
MIEISSENTVQDIQTAPVFAPLMSVEAVTTATRGRQVFNDSDKDNYFEG